MSLRRVLRKLRWHLRRPPRTARDLVASYEQYLRLQGQEYLSHEEDVSRWAEGLRRYVRRACADLPRSTRILDCACGDGVGLETLRELGFSSLCGVELVAAKAARARARGFRIIEADMHDLGVLPAASFDVVLSSHTLEHAYDPGRALGELARALVAGGTLLVVLPFPDPGPRNELAHVGKYELGTHRDDGGSSVVRFFTAHGFDILARTTDTWRESELWLTLRRR